MDYKQRRRANRWACDAWRDERLESRMYAYDHAVAKDAIEFCVVPHGNWVVVHLRDRLLDRESLLRSRSRSSLLE